MAWRLGRPEQGQQTLALAREAAAIMDAPFTWKPSPKPAAPEAKIALPLDVKLVAGKREDALRQVMADETAGAAEVFRLLRGVRIPVYRPAENVLQRVGGGLDPLADVGVPEHLHGEAVRVAAARLARRLRTDPPETAPAGTATV